MGEIDRSAFGASLPNNSPFSSESLAALAAPTPPATIALLRALTLLAPRLHQATTARDPQALYALVCETLRACGLFAHITHLENPVEQQSSPSEGGAETNGQPVLCIVATSIDDEMRAGIEALIGTEFIGYPVAVTGPYRSVLERGDPVLVERLVDILAPIVPHLSPEERAKLAQWARADRAILAAIVSGGAVRGVLSVWGPSALLGVEDAPVVGALAAQVGTALENARLLADAERERERWRATVEGAPEFVATCDANLRLTYVNPIYRREIGVSEGLNVPLDERVARFGLLLPDGSGPFPPERLPLRQALTAAGPVHGIEMLHRDVRGEDRYILWSAAPMRDAAGGLLGAVCVGRDVTTQRRMQRELAAHAGQVEATFDAMVDAVALYDGDGKVVRANAACRRLLGLDHDPRYDQRFPAERMALLSATTPDGRPLQREEWPMMRLLRGETIAGGTANDFLVHTLDGREVLLSPSGAPVRDASGNIIGGVAIYRDVTQRRRLARELRQRAGELESIFESITDGVTVYGPRGEVKYLNRAYRTMLALSSEELQRPIDARGRAIIPRRPETGGEMPREEWPSTRILAGESLTGAGSVDVLVRAHDGRELLINCTGAPVRGEQGEIIGAVMVIRDVGERRRLEHRAQEALSALLAMAEALVHAPPEAAQTAMMAGTADVTPDATSDASSQPHAQTTGPLGDSPFAERDATQRLAELALRVLNCRHVSIVALYDPRSPRSVGVSEATDAAFAQRVYGVAIAGFPAEHVQDWWRRFGAGVPVELLATPEQLDRLRAGESFFAQPRARAYRGEAFGVSTELWAPLRSGSQLIGAMAIDYGDNPDPDEPVERGLTPQDRALAEAVGKLVTLVIERERLLREREEARASELALRQANERLDTFISLASHELRTPLTTIMANAQIALRRAQRVAEEASERGYGNVAEVEKLVHLLERTQAAAERQNRLVGDLLDVSRIHAGKLELRPESLDLAALVADAVEEQRLGRPERIITLRVPTERVVVSADGERIRQVIANYLTNALKYAPAAQPIEVTLSLTRLGQTGMARVQVRDHGPGIAPEEQEHIWERFYRVPGVDHQSGSGIGLGLGLYICRQIVERHGGTVGVESAPGRGSTFSFTLPAGR